MRALAVCLSCVGILAPPAACALDLGVLEARSALYEPLDARIALHDVQAVDTGEIEVTLGSRSQFEIAGVARPFHLTRIEFSVVGQDDGHAYIQLRTQDPVIQPSLTFLINVDWPRGHAIRGYNLNLTPAARGVTGASAARRTAPETEGEPEARPAAPEPSPSASGTADAAMPEAPPPAPDGAADDAAARDPPPPAPARAADGGAYGPVHPHDTLWVLALRFRPDASISVQRMMLAFVEANPRTFELENVNGLNAGVILRIPTRDEIGLDDRAAVAEVQRHNQAWKQHRENRRAARARAAPASDAPVSAAPSTGPARPELVLSPSPPEPGAQPGGRLEVVSPETSPDAGALEEGTDVRALRTELALAMETADVKRLENEEITSRLAEAEQRIEELYRLVKLKDDEIAALQARLRAAAEAESPPARESLEAESSPEAESPPEGESPETESPPEGEPAPDTSPLGAEEPMSDTGAGLLPFGRNALAVNPVFLVGAAGLILTLLGGAVLLRRRRALAGKDDAFDSPAAPSANGDASPYDRDSGTGDDLDFSIGGLTGSATRAAAGVAGPARLEGSVADGRAGSVPDAIGSDPGGSPGVLPVAPDDDSMDEDGRGVFAPEGVGGDIVQTKIDLAQVYMEMGDAENARSFLDEVLAEGSADQRKTARAMLSKLA